MRLPVLTAREQQVRAFLAAGLSNLEISQRMGVAVPTVKSHASRLYLKLGIKGREQLANTAPPVES